MTTLALIVAACGAVEGDVAEPTTTTTEATTTSQASAVSTTQPEFGSELAPVVEMARADLAFRLKVDESSIEVVSAESVTWPDGAIGCPEPGKMYTQALVDGHRIVLGHDERVFGYHSGGDQAPFLCPNPDSKDGGYEFIPPPRGDVEK